jgi:3-oxoacyl-[acyl-carrier protein] reductase
MEHRSVLVTGASRGIGAAIASRLARDGFEVVLNYRSGEQAARSVLDAIEGAGGKGRLLPFDISEREMTKTAISGDMEAHGTYWGVVCNAGIAVDAPFPLMDGDAWDSVIKTNLDGFYNVVHPIVMPLVESRRGGRIVTLSSISGLVGNRGQVNYSAAKAGIIGATKALSKELARRKITVNCVVPGIIETDMTRELPKDEVLKMIPMRRYGLPEEVAGLAAYLVSDESAYVTGQAISINGGMA